MKSIFKIIAIIIFSLITLQAEAKENYFKEKKKVFSAALNQGAYVEISNQYGDLEIIPSKNDSVRIEVFIRVNSKNEDQAVLKEMLNSIIINFVSGQSYVIAETKWGASSFFAKSYQSIKAGLDSKSNNVKIDYKVYVPITTELVLRNKFGNIYMDNHTGDVDVKVSYGELRARNLDNVKNIDIRYGKLKINKINDGSFKLVAVKYLEINEAREIRVTSSSSDINIRKAKSINLASRHDEITIEEVDMISGRISLTDLKIRKINNAIVISSKFGSIRIDECSPKMSKIDLEVSRADVNLRFGQEFSSVMDLEISEDKYLNHSYSITRISPVQLLDDGFKIKLEVGAGSETISRIRSNKGYVDLSN